MSHYHFSKTSIQTTCLIDATDYIACHKDSYVNVYDVLEGIKTGGTVLLNSPWSVEEMEEKLPLSMCRTIARKKLKFYNIDADKIAGEVGLDGRINMIMKTAFFILANVIPVEEATAYIKAQIKINVRQERRYDRQDEHRCGGQDARQSGADPIPASWAGYSDPPVAAKDEPAVISNVLRPMVVQQGDQRADRAGDLGTRGGQEGHSGLGQGI